MEYTNTNLSEQAVVVSCGLVVYLTSNCFQIKKVGSVYI